jgi:hypothetical protein
LQREVREVLLDEIRVEHRPVKGDEIAFHQQSAVKRGDVAVADEDLGVGADGPVVQKREESGSAIAAADADYGLYLAVSEHPHQITRAVAVAAGEEAPALADVGSKLGFEAEALEDGNGAVDVLRVRRRARGRDNPDGVAIVQTVRFGWHELKPEEPGYCPRIVRSWALV